MMFMEVTMTPIMEPVQPASAEILEAGGYQSLAVNQAMGKVRDVLSNRPSKSTDVFAVIVHEAHRISNDRSYLTVVNRFLEAYWKGWSTLSRLANEQKSSPRSNHIRTLKDQEAGDICIYWGQADAKDVKEKMDTSPGVYVIPSHLDSSLLGSLGLPPLPEPFREMPLVMQLKHSNVSVEEMEAEEKWNPWKTLTEALLKKARVETKIERDTLEWRDRFVSEYPCLTSAEVAQDSTSTAKNRAAIASRWLAEKKIFSIQFGRRVLFPKFQFQDGSPLPVISDMMEEFPKHATGWDYAFFLTTPNTFIGGRKPIELLRTNPEQLVSLAHSFANPADAF
jgi:hypothetical protein